MPTYLEIVVNVPQVEGVFHYHLPPELEGRVLPGHLVEVPFGRQRVQGVVIKQVEHPSVTEPAASLARRGLAVRWAEPETTGVVPVQSVMAAVDELP